MSISYQEIEELKNVIEKNDLVIEELVEFLKKEFDVSLEDVESELNLDISGILIKNAEIIDLFENAMPDEWEDIALDDYEDLISLSAAINN